MLTYAAYKSISSGLFLALFPPFWLYSRLSGKYQASIYQKAGLYPENLVETLPGNPRIWMHAVSVGEVCAAAPILKSLSELIPGCGFILSTGTEHGQAVARAKIGAAARCVYAPFDFFLSARRALHLFRPDILVCVETEIWPNWLMEAHRLGIKTAIVNGRLSVRSIRGYMKIRSLMQETLKQIHAFSMIGEADALRIQQIGAPPDRMRVNGNAKYDLLIREADEATRVAMKHRYRLDDTQPVFVAGSTRGRESEIILDAYETVIRSVPDTVLIVAPRHIRRAGRIKAQATARGLASQYLTELDDGRAARSAPIIIVDTIGELQATYSTASVVFCGGSLVPRGGQNILEAAVWAKPVLYGPSMEDFTDARNLLEAAGGGVRIGNGQDLAEKVIYYLKHPGQSESVGKCAHRAVSRHRGAARKHAGVILKVLEGPPRHE